MLDYYAILGLPPTANAQQIKDAFKQMAKRYHPDSPTGGEATEELFKQVNEAYQVLSDPMAKSMYDLKQTYEQTYQETSQAYHNPPYRRPNYRKPPPFYKPEPVSSRRNVMATVCAFLVILLIGGTYYGVQRYHDHQEAMERARLAQQRGDIFSEAVVQKQLGNWEAALSILKQLGYLSGTELDVAKFKEEILQELETKAEEDLVEGNYTKAAEELNLLKTHSTYFSTDHKLDLAHAYHFSSQYTEALRLYQSLRVDGNKSLSLYYDIGLLYDEGFGDYEQADIYYQLSADRAVAEYESDMGDAYALLISPKTIPSQHYEVYLRLSKVNLKLKNYEKALSTTSWPSIIWPDSTVIWEIRSKAYKALGNQKKMREAMAHAKKTNPSFSL